MRGGSPPILRVGHKPGTVHSAITSPRLPGGNAARRHGPDFGRGTRAPERPPRGLGGGLRKRTRVERPRITSHPGHSRRGAPEAHARGAASQALCGQLWSVSTLDSPDVLNAILYGQRNSSGACSIATTEIFRDSLLETASFSQPTTAQALSWIGTLRDFVVRFSE